ncbi:YgaP family membrane protein [Rhodovibrio salinarum]|uniref:DUF2892 domain-containing protein n=1 Tax=Rhodovibrio salinarum TaxID=1087 RepID=A0A934UYM7_9PROT|nr:DUF2892 domain-containing protein [Rhodovibrio salinarum]MBK1695714.1 DUF2892 domain-containing protein [Rhodovibrio salinarum]
MTLDRIVMALIGAIVVVTVILSQVHAGGWLWVTVIFGAHLFQMAFTGFCPLAKLLKSVGMKPGAALN